MQPTRGSGRTDEIIFPCKPLLAGNLLEHIRDMTWKDCFPCAAGLLRMILFVASAAHVIVAFASAERPHFALYPGSMLEDQAALLTVSVPVLPFEVPERVSRLLGLEAAAKATLSHR